MLEATNGGTLQIDDPVTGSGSAIIEGGKLAFDAPSNVNVTFNNGPNGTTYGELVLGDGSDFSGRISGFTGSAPGVAHSDAIDLVGINYNSSAFSKTFSASTGLLTVTDGTHAASLTFVNFDETFSLASDGHGGTLITDPPATNSSNMSVSIGGVGNDTFVFKPGIGPDRIADFNPQVDTLELSHFAHVQNVKDWRARYPRRARQRVDRARPQRQHLRSRRGGELLTGASTKPGSPALNLRVRAISGAPLFWYREHRFIDNEGVITVEEAESLEAELDAVNDNGLSFLFFPPSICPTCSDVIT